MPSAPFDFVAAVRAQVWTNWNRTFLVLLVILSVNGAASRLIDDQPVAAAQGLLVDATTFLILLCFRELVYRRVDRDAEVLRAAYARIRDREPAGGPSLALTRFRQRTAAAAVFNLALNRKPDVLTARLDALADRLAGSPWPPAGKNATPNGARLRSAADASDCSQGHPPNCKHKRL